MDNRSRSAWTAIFGTCPLFHKARRARGGAKPTARRATSCQSHRRRPATRARCALAVLPPHHQRRLRWVNEISTGRHCEPGDEIPNASTAAVAFHRNSERYPLCRDQKHHCGARPKRRCESSWPRNWRISNRCKRLISCRTMTTCRSEAAPRRRKSRFARKNVRRSIGTARCIWVPRWVQNDSGHRKL